MIRSPEFARRLALRIAADAEESGPPPEVRRTPVLDTLTRFLRPLL